MEFINALLNYRHYFITYGTPHFFMGFVVIVLLPMVYFGVIRRNVAEGERANVALWFMAVCVAIAYGDIAVTGVQAQYLCTHEAGLRVFRTAETEGILGVSANNFLGMGFKYVEFGSDALGKWRETLVNGAVNRERVSSFQAEYELTHPRVPQRFCCNTNIDAVQNRRTGEILGQTINFEIRHGWLDLLLPFQHSSVFCAGPEAPPSGSPKNMIYPDSLIKAVLHPASAKGALK